jgi:hypothetical protein
MKNKESKIKAVGEGAGLVGSELWFLAVGLSFLITEVLCRS